MRKFLLFKVILILLTGTLLAKTESVTISPDNTSPEVKFYSTYTGESHMLTVNVASGYKFSKGPSLDFTSDVLWSGSGSNFMMAAMDGITQVQASVSGEIVPDGSGGGGGSAKSIPFTVSMISRYFTINFYEPDTENAWLFKGDLVDVSVLVQNAVGEPSAGHVSFSSPLGTFGPNSAPLANGMATGQMLVEADADTKGKIKAYGDDIDITNDKKADGESESIEFTVWDVEFVSFETTGDIPRGVVFDLEYPNDVCLVNYQAFLAKGKLIPNNAPDELMEKITAQIAQDVKSWRYYFKKSGYYPEYASLITGIYVKDGIQSGVPHIIQREVHYTGYDRPAHGRAPRNEISSLILNDSFRSYFQIKTKFGNGLWRTIGSVTGLSQEVQAIIMARGKELLRHQEMKGTLALRHRWIHRGLEITFS